MEVHWIGPHSCFMRSHQNLSLGPTEEPWLPHRDTTVLLLSASTELQGAVGRVSAAAAVELLVGQAGASGGPMG